MLPLAGWKLLISFKKIPDNSGIAFLVMQYLNPTHTGNMPALLNKYTSLPVYKAKDYLKVDVNYILT